MKLGLLAASLVLVAGGAVACGDGDGDGGGGGGGGDDAPSAKDFCGALKDFRDDVADADPTKDYIQTIKNAADKLEDVGTPGDMPTDAQDGFDFYVEKIKGLDDNATLDDLAGIGDVSDEEQKKLDALDEYVSKTCPELEGEPNSSESP